MSCKFATYIYDYHTSSLTSNPQLYSPFLHLLPNGYFIMAPKRSFKDDIVFVPLPNLKPRSKFANTVSSAKMVKPKLPGSNKLKVNRKSGINVVNNLKLLKSKCVKEINLVKLLIHQEIMILTM